jgi:hypothetical protein
MSKSVPINRMLQQSFNARSPFLVQHFVFTIPPRCGEAEQSTTSAHKQYAQIGTALQLAERSSIKTDCCKNYWYCQMCAKEAGRCIELDRPIAKAQGQHTVADIAVRYWEESEAVNCLHRREGWDSTKYAEGQGNGSRDICRTLIKYANSIPSCTGDQARD